MIGVLGAICGRSPLPQPDVLPPKTTAASEHVAHSADSLLVWNAYVCLYATREYGCLQIDGDAPSIWPIGMSITATPQRPSPSRSSFLRLQIWSTSCPIPAQSSRPTPSCSSRAITHVAATTSAQATSAPGARRECQRARSRSYSERCPFVCLHKSHSSEASGHRLPRQIST